MPGIAPPPWARDRYPSGALVDHWLNMRWSAPAHLRLEVGLKAHDAALEPGQEFYTAHLLTPETEHSTHYFYTSGRPELEHPAGSTIIGAMNPAFEFEDRPMLEAVEQSMADPSVASRKPVILNVDAGAVRARRLLQEAISKEALLTQNTRSPG
jgi:vanillate O-demethylase monooxygenase subunit